MASIFLQLERLRWRDRKRLHPRRAPDQHLNLLVHRHDQFVDLALSRSAIQSEPARARTGSDGLLPKGDVEPAPLLRRTHVQRPATLDRDAPRRPFCRDGAAPTAGRERARLFQCLGLRTPSV